MQPTKQEIIEALATKLMGDLVTFHNGEWWIGQPSVLFDPLEKWEHAMMLTEALANKGAGIELEISSSGTVARVQGFTGRFYESTQQAISLAAYEWTKAK